MELGGNGWRWWMERAKGREVVASGSKWVKVGGSGRSLVEMDGGGW